MSVAVPEATAQRSNIIGHALMFIGGFTLVFVALGATTGLLFGTFFQDGLVDLLIAVGGITLLVLGIHMSGLLKWVARSLESGSSLQKLIAAIDWKMDQLILPERRKQAGYDQSPGFIRSSVVGMAFAAGWTPCIGPLLGAILTLSLNASAGANTMAIVFKSAVLLFAYSMGLAVPFLLTAWVLNKATTLMTHLKRHMRIIELVSALFLIAMGLLLLFGSLSTLNQYFSEQPEWAYQLETALTGYGISIPLAFVAGLLSFLSPCVLPLIPVYLGYLTGVAVASNTATSA